MHPVLLDLGFFQLHSYGLAMALSFVLGLTLAIRLNRRLGRPDEELLDLFQWLVFGGLLGARTLYVIVMWPEFAAGPWYKVFAIWQGGLVYYGGLIGASTAALIWLRNKGLPLWSYLDVLAPGIALGQVTGRLGCFFAGCCYGREDHAHGLVFPSIGDNLPHLPTMLYESAYCVLLAGFLTWLWLRRKFDGQIFWVFVACYAFWRFGLEYLRGDAERGTLINGLFSPSQWISLGAVVAASAMLYFLSRPGRAGLAGRV
jgi:phosphatidylglycerol:prolipoprotein diacylglycerol transferase